MILAVKEEGRLSESIKKENSQQVIFSDNIERSSKILWKTSVDVKANVK